jgi:transketolase
MIPNCKNIRKSILSISKESGHGHIPTCFSVVEILYAVYSTIKHDPERPQWDDRDIFILSKGHASLAHYTVLAHFGYFNMQDVCSYGAYNSDFGCHADRLKMPGIEASTGSLGHGIGLAAGMALARKISKHPGGVYTLIGDGESNEGSVWEAVMVANNLNLSNLTIIYDNNMSHSRGLQIHNPAERFNAFGCKVTEADGHNPETLTEALGANDEKVKVIVANTIKGYGCRTLVENQYQWHRRSPNDDEFEKLIEELDEKAV